MSDRCKQCGNLVDPVEAVRVTREPIGRAYLTPEMESVLICPDCASEPVPGELEAEAAEGWRLLGELWDLCNRYFVEGEDAPVRNWLDKHNSEAEEIRERLLEVVRQTEGDDEECGWSLAEQMARDAAGEIEG